MPLSIWSLVGILAAGPAASAAGDLRPVPADSAQEPWIRRHLPRRHTVELGLAFGPLFVPGRHGLIDDAINLESGGTFYQRYASAINLFALRCAYFPLPSLGIEVEGGIAPTYTREYRERANLYTARGRVIAQLPWWSATPYLFLGGGLLGAQGALGSDIDPAGSFGLGAKFFANARAILRIDLQDTLARRVDGGAAHYVQLTFGLALGLYPGRRGQRQLTRR